MIPRDVFVERVRSYVGTPFHHRGRLPGVALDCAGVVAVALSSFGVAVPDIRYGTSPAEGDVIAGLRAVAYSVDIAERRPGDVLTLQVDGQAIHMGVLVAEDRIVQPSAHRRIVEQRLTRALHIRGCWRIREVG